MINLKKFKNELHSQKGFTLVEMAVTLLILSMFITFGYQGIEIIMQDIDKTETYNARTSLISNLLNTLVADSKSYQIDYTDKTGAQYLEDYRSFKNAWDLNGTITSVKKCSECRGRFAYIMEPIIGNKQMNILIVKIYHPKFEGTSKVKTYRRIVGTR